MRRNIYLITLTDGIFETGAYGVPSKSKNSTILGQGGPSSAQCSNPSWERLAPSVWRQQLTSILTQY